MKTLRNVAICWSVLGASLLLFISALFSVAADAQTITLGEAVDNTSLTWTTGGDADWFGQTDVYYYDGDAAQSGTLVEGQSSWIETTVTGPGTLSFYWGTGSVSDDLYFYIDGVSQTGYYSFHGWELQIFPIPSGSHTLRWGLETRSGVQGTGWLDKALFTEGPGPTIGEAVDNTSLTWTTGGDADWFGQTEVSHQDGDAARSGNVREGSGRSSWLETTVTGPGVLSFYWRVSSSYETEDLNFSIDGVEESSCRVYKGWDLQIFQIPPGSHTLRWIFDPDVFHAGAAGYLDEVVFTGGAGPTIGEALDNTSLIWTTGGDADWFGQTAVYYYDGDAARSGNIDNDQSSWVETTVTGPGILSFYSRSSSIDGSGVFQFGIDDGVYRYWINSVWRLRMYSIVSGSHRVRWGYAPYNDHPGEGILLDQVVFDTDPAIVITSPEDGETWYHRVFRTIRWVSHEGTGPYVTIELYRAGQTSHVIATSTDNDGYYNWFVPTVLEPATDYQIKITSVSDSSVYDVSDGYLSVSASYQSSFGGALVLDGIDDYAETGDHPELDVGIEPAESFTVEGWAYIETVDWWDNPMGLIIARKPENYTLLVHRYRDSQIPSQTKGCIGFYLTGLGNWVCRWPPYSSGWHHVAGVYYAETGMLRTYIDGEPFIDECEAGPPDNSAESLRIGSDIATVFGAVDEVRISDIARYTGSYTVPTSPLSCDAHTRALWNFDEYHGATVLHDACGAADNFLVGHNGARTEGGEVLIPEADFTASHTTGFAPLTVVFTNTSGGVYTSSTWSFGDHTTSTLENPIHTYEVVGAYTVALTISGTVGMDTVTRTNYIHVDEPVQASFSASPRSGEAPLIVQFTDMSSGPVATREWDFGDGAVGTLQYPSHVYMTGTYTVALTVRAAGGSAALPGGTDTLTRTNYIRAQAHHEVYLPLVLRNH